METQGLTERTKSGPAYEIFCSGEFTSPSSHFEPHPYLHPMAERQVVDFLFSHTEHRYVIATHSAILINSVPADRILVLGNSNTVAMPTSESSSVPALLHSLGYRNSDLLFNDRLIFIEGESDQDVLPLVAVMQPSSLETGPGKDWFPGDGRRGSASGKRPTNFSVVLGEIPSSAREAKLSPCLSLRRSLRLGGPNIVGEDQSF
jgi:hypothetical protein